METVSRNLVKNANFVALFPWRIGFFANMNKAKIKIKNYVFKLISDQI